MGRKDILRFILFLFSILTNSNIRSQELAEGIYLSQGSCNTYFIKTREGYVLIDPGSEGSPSSARIRPIRDSVSAILLTHGHTDHTVNLKEWKELNVPVYANKEFIEFQHYIKRLTGFFAIRNSAQGAPVGDTILCGNYCADILPDHFFTTRDTLTIGTLHFVLIHTRGETPDQTLIWIPEKKAAFIGDNYYTSFPNMYTLRGTKPRWALDYANANDLVIRLGAETLFPGHGSAIIGKNNVVDRVKKYRDAILYVHDETVKGMNEGKDMYTLMKDIQLPDSLKMPEFFGRVSWSVRGIYEGYAGWFDGNPVHMYPFASYDLYDELIKLSGGIDKIARRCLELTENEELLPALSLTDIVLYSDPENVTALGIRKTILEKLRAGSRNGIENAWLDYELNWIRLLLE